MPTECQPCPPPAGYESWSAYDAAMKANQTGQERPVVALVGSQHAETPWKSTSGHVQALINPVQG
jgi:hypothetical protein